MIKITNLYLIQSQFTNQIFSLYFHLQNLYKRKYEKKHNKLIIIAVI